MPKRFPLVRITGGPVGHGTKVEIDGREVEGATDAELFWGVNDVNRMTLTQIVKVEIESTMDVSGPIRVLVPETFLTEHVEATADTLWEALYDCARQLELAAEKANKQGSTAGTI